VQLHKRKAYLGLTVAGVLLGSTLFMVVEAEAASPASNGQVSGHVISQSKHFTKGSTASKKTLVKKKSYDSKNEVQKLSNIIALTRKKVAQEKSVSVKIGASFAINKGAILEHSNGNITEISGELQDTIVIGKKTGHLNQILSHKVAYCKGNVVGLEYGCGLTAAQADKATNKWVAIPDTKQNSSLYKSSAGDMTIGAAFASLFPSSLTSYHLAKNIYINKINAYSIVGTVPGSISSTLPKGISEEFYVAANGSYLPLRVQLTTKGVGELVDFSNWGKAQAPGQPQQSVNINKL